MADDQQETNSRFSSEFFRASFDRFSKVGYSLSSDELSYSSEDEHQLANSLDNSHRHMLYSNPSAFQDIIVTPAHILDLVKNDSIWKYLGKGYYNLADQTTMPVMISTEHSQQYVVRKQTFPIRNVYLYRSKKTEFNLKIKQHFYFCSILRSMLADTEPDPTLNDLTTTIRELKNAISLAQEPTSSCILS